MTEAIEKRLSEVREKAAALALAEEPWKTGYRLAVTRVLVERGNIVNGPGRHSYGMYFADKNEEKTRHLTECGYLAVYDVEEHAWDEWEFNSMDDGPQTSYKEYKVTAKVTCNCGELIEADLQVDGNFSNITQDVLKF